MKTLLITLLLSSSAVQAARFVVEAKKPLSAQELASGKGIKIYPWIKNNDPYLSRLYSVEGDVSKDELQKLAWVKNVENTVEISKLSLLPGENPSRIVNDELFPYQWGLMNQGQSYIREKDDIHNIPLKGIDSKDVGWQGVYNNLPSARPIVAVLDSGVDLGHPDLQGNLWKNEKECGKDSSVDNDNNKLPGDCHGWNFTAAIDDPQARNPQDNDGHGSHVAGIIAAARNEIGIVGVNPNALIMPVKVMRDSNSKSNISASESFAQGIIYAVNMGAHVINMSLGWPRSLETKHLRDAVYYALSRNVIIVAAAGNNNSVEPLFPCAYDGVICAGSSTLDGRYAGYSNFGGHVDGVTPGEGILSLNPMMLEPEFFSVSGYDIKSGTSQSAPLLAGLISIVKAQEPRISIDEIYGRIYSATRNPDNRKYTLGGDITWEVISKKVTGPVIRPVLKRVRQLVVTGGRADTKLSIPVRNFGSEAANISVKVESLSSGVVFQAEAQQLESLKHAEVRDLIFNAHIVDMSAESSLKFKITLETQDRVESFFNEIPVVRDIRSEPTFQKLGFSFQKSTLPVGNVVDGKIVSYMSTVESYGKSHKHEFFMRKTNAKEKKIEINVLRREGNKINEAAAPIVIEGATLLVNFLRLDLNLDGQDDYFIQTLNEDDKGDKFLQYSFFNSEMKALWPKFQNIKVTIDLVIQSLNDVMFTRMDHPELGAMMVPAYFTEGQIPKVDQVQDFFGRFDASREYRLYYLEPQLAEQNLRIRALTTLGWKENLKKELNANWYETVLVENILPVSVEDARLGQLRVVLSVGQGTKRQIMISTFNTKNTLKGATLPQIVLQTEGVDTVYSVTATGLDAVGDAYLNIYDRSRVKIVTTKNNTQSSQQNYTHESETDLIAGHIASFENGQSRLSILQTREELVSLSTVNGKVTKTTRPKLRYSFFSNQVLSEMYHPVIYKRNGTQAPALYVDSTAVTSNRVYLFEEQAGALVASIKNSLVVPATCKALNPSFSIASGSHEFVFLCLENKEWFLRTFEMQ